MPPSVAPKPSGNPAASRAKSGASAPPARVVLLVGAESGGKNAEVQRMIAEHVDSEFADFDSELLDGHTATADRVLSAASLAPFGSAKRVVVVRDAQQMNLEEQKRIAVALDRIPPNGILILHTGMPIVEEGKVKRQSTVSTELANAVKRSGRVLEFGLPRAEDARSWILKEASATGKTLTSEALTLLSQLTGDDIQRMRTEIEKASAHAGESPTISGADVEATISRGSDDVIFKLCDAIGARRTSEAMGHVSTLFKATSARADAVAARTLVLIVRHIRLLTQFHYLVERRMAGRGAATPSEEIVELLPADGAASMAVNPRTRWMSDKYAGQARNFSGSELASRLELLLESDLALKGIVPGGDAPQALLQRLVVALC